MKEDTGILRMLLIGLVQAEHERLDGKMCKPESSCRKYIGNSRVHRLIVTTVCLEIRVNSLSSDDPRQVLSVDQDLDKA